MMTRLRHLTQKLLATYWFIPSLMMAVATALALFLIWADHNWIGSPTGKLWIYSGGAEGARSLLSTVAGSVITVAGVGFSITIVTLTQASSQFGPRLLRNFMSDRGNQIVLGTWTGTFIYGVLVLGTVRGSDHGAFVPNASVAVAVLLSMASVAALVYFIHHVSTSLQAPQLVAAVARDFEKAIRRAFPVHSGQGAPSRGSDVPEEPRPDFAADGMPVGSPESGYLQAVDEGTLMKLASRHDLRLRVVCRPGDFLMRDQPLLLAAPSTRLREDVVRRLRRSFLFGSQATHEQDLEFAIKQMVEVALRSLSTGVNDPFTAIHCVDWLTAGLSHAARHRLPSALRHDGQGTLRVVARAYSFAGAVDAAYNQIRQHARGSLSVTIRLLEALAELGAGLEGEDQREAVRRQVELTWEGAAPLVECPQDRADLQARYHRALRALEASEAVEAR